MKSLNKALFAIALIAAGASLPAAAEFSGQYNSNGNYGVFEVSSTAAAKPASAAATHMIVAKQAAKTSAVNLDSPWGGQYNSDGNYGVFQVAHSTAPTRSAAPEAQIAGHYVDGANSAM
jgi:hypothetical protein